MALERLHLINFLFDDDEELLERGRRRRIVNVRPDYFNIFDDQEFIKKFRLSKEAVMLVLEEIEMWISPPSSRNNAVPGRLRLLLALRFYATGSMLVATAGFSGVSKTCACDFVRIVTVALCNLKKQYIAMPQTPAEIAALKHKFHAMAGVPSVIGVLDCTHIHIKNPGGDNSEMYRNSEGVLSIKVQTISDTTMKIMNIIAKCPGSVHNETIFNSSKVKNDFENGFFGTGLLIGGSEYGKKKYLIMPSALPVLHKEKRSLYNERVIKARSVGERLYELWKKRFPILSLEMRVAVKRVQAVIIATAILHNISVLRNEEMPPDEETVSGQV